MRWASWALGILGVVQYAIIAYLNRDGDIGYVTTDMAYLVMWLAVMGGLLLGYLSCWGGCYGDDCDCCEDGCTCGDGPCCTPGNGKSMGHEGHGHDGGHSHEGHSH